MTSTLGRFASNALKALPDRAGAFARVPLFAFFFGAAARLADDDERFFRAMVQSCSKSLWC
jgi:hypothetical protein